MSNLKITSNSRFINIDFGIYQNEYLSPQVFKIDHIENVQPFGPNGVLLQICGIRDRQNLFLTCKKSSDHANKKLLIVDSINGTKPKNQKELIALLFNLGAIST